MKRWVTITIALLSVGCGQDTDGGPADAGPSCLDQPLGADCAPQYEPTFANVYQNTIVARCAIGGGACHLAEGAQGGLVLEGIDAAYAGLQAAGRVVGGDPGCSVMIQRLEAPDPSRAMPPGTPLTEPERCAVTQWVRRGAQR